MFQTEKLTAVQTKAMESVNILTHLAFDSANTVTDIQYDLAKQAVHSMHSKATEFTKIKDVKEMVEWLKPQSPQIVLPEVMQVQNKITKVLRKNKSEVIEMIESAIDDSKSETREIVKDFVKNTPVSSEPVISTFESIIDASIQSYDQGYVASKEVFEMLEKSFDSTMSAFYGQLAPEKKSTVKRTKVIAA